MTQLRVRSRTRNFVAFRLLHPFAYFPVTFSSVLDPPSLKQRMPLAFFEKQKVDEIGVDAVHLEKIIVRIWVCHRFRRGK